MRTPGFFQKNDLCLQRGGWSGAAVAVFMQITGHMFWHEIALTYLPAEATSYHKHEE